MAITCGINGSTTQEVFDAINNVDLIVWIAEAEAMTSESYATEAEDVLVKIYTSNNDGTFSFTNNGDYSSYHWKQKAGAIVIEPLSGVMGRLTSPLLDLPLQNSLSMNKGVGSTTFSRSTTATYIDRYGVLQTADIDEPRFEKDGLLIEGASTNLVTDSNTFTGSITSVTQNQIAPDGTLNNAWELVGDGTSGEHYVHKLASVADDTSTYTVSVYVKKGTQDTISYMCYIVGGTTVSSATAFTFSTETITGTGTVTKLSDGWYRLTNTITNNASGNTTLYNRVYIDVGGITTSTDTLYIYGMQSEKLQFASSYIPTTTTAVTRGAENCYADLINNSPYLIGNYSVACDVSILGKNISNTAWSISNSAYIMFRPNLGDGNGNMWYGNASSFTNVSFDNTLKTVVGVYTDTTITSYVDSVAGSTATEDFTTIENGLNRIQIGSERDTAVNQLFGHIKNFKIYDVSLTSEEVKLL